MKRIVYGNEKVFVPWAQERIGVVFRNDARSMGIEKDGVLVGVTVFDSFSEVDVDMHVASDGSCEWLSKEYLFRCFTYPFTQLNMRRVTALVPAKNKAALEFNSRLGFIREGVHRHAQPDDDLISMGMLREECKWI